MRRGTEHLILMLKGKATLLNTCTDGQNKGVSHGRLPHSSRDAKTNKSQFTLKGH